MIRRILACVAILGWAATTLALTVDVDYGHRLIHEGWSAPPPYFQEGGVVATFVADAPVDTAVAVDGLERVDALRWSYTFAWNAADSMTFFFEEEGGGELVTVRALPGWPGFVPEPRPLPVLELFTGPDSLWSPDRGIYVWGEGDIPNWDRRGDAWERTGELRWWNEAGVLRHQRPVGIRINGNYSRSFRQKSLRLYFDHHGDPEIIVEDVFGEGPEEHARLILRGACRYPHLFIKDPLCTDLFAALGHLRCRWSPVEAYLDGDYWGMYHLRDRADTEWAERVLGLAGDYVMVKGFDDGLHGDPDAWPAFLGQATEYPEPAANDFFLFLDGELDLVTYLDWVLFQCWCASADNGGRNNLVVLRPEGGRWLFVMYDQDSAFVSVNLEAVFFRFFTSANEAEFDARKPPAFYQDYTWNCRQLFALFRQVMSNSRGRRLCRERWSELTSGVLNPGAVQAAIGSVVDRSQPGEARHAGRWGASLSLAAAAVQVVDFVQARQPLVGDQFLAFMDDWMDPVELDAFAVNGDASGARLQWHVARQLDLLGWIVERRLAGGTDWVEVAGYGDEAALVRQGDPDAPRDYSYLDATIDAGAAADYRLVHVDLGGERIVHPWAEEVVWDDPPPPALCINEFLASNDANNADEAGDFDDWVEIFNPTAATVDLGGWFLSDEIAEPMKWVFPPASLVPPGGHLLVWCDEDPGDGPVPASSKLDADGEAVTLAAPAAGGVTLVDSHVFGAQQTDVSEGRCSDGALDWCVFAVPTPGGPNGAVPVPDALPGGLSLDARPNPFNPVCRLRIELPVAGEATLDIHDLAGRRIRRLVRGELAAGHHELTWRGRGDDGRAMPSGVYYARLRAGPEQRVRKLTLVR